MSDFPLENNPTLLTDCNDDESVINWAWPPIEISHSPVTTALEDMSELVTD